MVKKNAQQEEFDFNDLDVGDLLFKLQDHEPLDVDMEDIEVSSDDKPSAGEVIFVLDEIPGAPGAQKIEIEPERVEVSGDDPADVDLWKWEPKGFLEWLQRMFDGVPVHSGYDTTGLEKAISYFETLDREITKAMRTDYKNEIDSAKAESAREQIENGLERLVERLEQVKKTKFKRHVKKSKGWANASNLVTTGDNDNQDLVKEAQKMVNITGITVTVPLLISRIARVCINGMVSAGHDIEDMYKRQVDEWKLDKREQAELAQLLSDMGYPMLQDRGFAVGEPVEKWRNDNFDWAAQYRG